MKPTHSDPLAELIHGELMKLPEHQAPSSLIPGVLARIEERKRRWWKQPWTEWPFTARLLLLPSALVCGGAFMTALALLPNRQIADRAMSSAGDAFRPMTPMLDLMTTLGNAALLALQSLEQPWIIGAAVIAFLMYLSCVALGAACFRLVAQRH